MSTAKGSDVVVEYPKVVITHHHHVYAEVLLAIVVQIRLLLRSLHQIDVAS